MTALDVLQQLHELDIALEPYLDGTLRYKAPQGTLTPALLDGMRQHKPELYPQRSQFELLKNPCVIYDGASPYSVEQKG